MAAIHKLSAGAVEGEIRRKIKTPKLINDGGGLYLQVARSGSVSWILRYRSPVTGKKRDMGLGSAHKLPMKRAREEAKRLGEMVHAGLDPIVERDKAGKNAVTFRQRFEYMDKLQPRFGWREMLDIHAMPVLGDKRIDAITTEDVVGIIAGLTNAGKHETARKLQQRIQAVIRSAKNSIDTVAHKAYICNTLSSFKKVKKNKAFPSLDFEKLPAFFRELQARPELAARALEFVTLTVCRPGSIVGVRSKYERKPPLRWTDIDFKRRVWIVPAVKTADQHDPQPFEIPLSDAAMDVLARVKAMKLHDEIVFVSQYHAGPMAVSAMRQQTMQRMRPGLTVHGMRTAFRTWVGEKTDFSRELINTAMAHQVFSENKAEAAYKSKLKFFAKRRAMMDRWADYVTGKNKVVALKAA